MYRYLHLSKNQLSALRGSLFQGLVVHKNFREGLLEEDTGRRPAEFRGEGGAGRPFIGQLTG